MSLHSSIPALATIQKLLNMIPSRQRERSLLQSLFCSESFQLLSEDLPERHLPNLPLDDHSSLYRLSTVGVLLAGYMLMHLLKSSANLNEDQLQSQPQPQSSSKDVLALLSWAVKPISNQEDLRSVLYSLDVLCTCRQSLYAIYFLFPLLNRLSAFPSLPSVSSPP
jgi:hypothetical protein